MTALVSPSKSTGSTTMLVGGALAETGGDMRVVRRHIGQQNALLFDRALAHQSFAELNSFQVLRLLLA